MKGLIKMAHNIGATALSSLGTDVFLGCYSGCPMSEAEFTDWALCGKVRRAT